jgi:hypothetical protein
VLIAIASGLWWIIAGRETPRDADATIALAPQAALTSDRPEMMPDGGPRHGIPERGAGPHSPAPTIPGQLTAERAESLIRAGEQAAARDDPVAARTHFSEAIALGVAEPELFHLRAELTRLGNETVFSARAFENDPGPFRAVVEKEAYSLDVYLGNTFLKHFKVGLGADGSTPTGEWRVGTKLRNPTYYPPRGGRIVAADDPENPLGEHWIGIVGVDGEAAGQERYGIHGTIDPESVGQNISLGCIRLYNEDVELLYSYLVEKGLARCSTSSRFKARIRACCTPA